MQHAWNRLLLLFGNKDIYTYKRLLQYTKDSTIIDEAISLNYIVMCGKTDIGEPQYRITPLGIKVRDN